MDRQQVSGMVGTLRGSPATVLLALLLMGGGPLQVVELEGLTGYSRQTVSKGLRRLENLGLAEELPGRYDGWVLTSRVHQMVLGEVRELKGDGDVKSFNVDSSSSSCLSSRRDSEALELEQLPQPREVKNFNLDDSGRVAVAVMARLGCDRRKARDTVRLAVEGGWTQGKVRAEAESWERYCLSDRGSGIKAPGYFLASRLADCQEAPWAPESDEEPSDGRRYIEGKYSDFVMH